MKVKSESEVAQSCPTLRDPTPWTAAYQAPPSMGFSRQEYWSGVPLPSLNMLSRLVITFLPNLSSLVAQTVKHLPTMRETQVQSLGWEDPLEKDMATHSSTLSWKIPYRGAL